MADGTIVQSDRRGCLDRMVLSSRIQNHCAANTIHDVSLERPFDPVHVEDNLKKVIQAALE